MLSEVVGANTERCGMFLSTPSDSVMALTFRKLDSVFFDRGKYYSISDILG